MLSAKNISLRLGQTDILKNVSLNINEGEFVGLLGSNGSGKSSLLKIIYRNISPTSGTIFLNGKNINEFTPKNFATQVAVLMQESESHFAFTVHEIVLMGRLPHKGIFERYNENDTKIVEESLEYVGALNLSSRIYNTLSGGEKQRILLARALAQKPKLLILDEPTNHLDIFFQIDILNLIRKLNITTLLALHDINIASAFCNKLHFLKEGKVLFSELNPNELSSQIVMDVYKVDSTVILNQKTKQKSILYNY